MKRILTAASLAIALSAHATHFSGGEIYYDCLGNNQYRITLMIYRDCAGINLNASYTVNFSSPCSTFTRTVNTPVGTEVSQLCGQQLPNSTCNGGTLPGIQQFAYQTVVTLPPCNFWTISWSLSNRNGAIANLTAPANQQMYIAATLNNALAPCDDSPQFTSIASPFVCLNYPVTYSLGAYDTDGDSLTYQLIDARGVNGSILAYNAPWSGQQPITGLTINPQTGLLSFTPTQAGNWVVVVQVNEFDSTGTLVGTVMRDMQFVAYPCSNVPPNASSGTVTNPSGGAVVLGPRTIEVCESASMCVDLVINDVNPSNVLTATTNLASVLPGATMTVSGTNPITCTVCWTGSNGTAGFYPFTINVNDGACPIPGIQTYAYTIHVLDGVFISAAATPASCQGVNNGSVAVTVFDGTAPYQYDWGSLPFNSPLITVGAGVYNVQVTDANGCESAPATAIVTAPSAPTANAGNNLVVCGGSFPINLNGAVTNAASAGWSGGSGTFTGTGTSVQYTPSAGEIAAGSTTLTLNAISGNGCPNASDAVQIGLSNSFVNATVSAVNATCSGTATGSATYAPALPGNTYAWSTVPVQTGPTATGLAPGGYNLTVTDALGCSGTFPVTIGQPQALSVANMQVVNENCAGQGNGSATVTPQGGTAPYTYLWSNGSTGSTMIGGAGTYTVTITDAAGCAPLTASATIAANAQNPTANAGPDLVGCTNSLPISLNGVITNAVSGGWTGGAGTMTGTGTNVLYMPSPGEIASGGVNLMLSAVSGNGCPTATDLLHIDLSNAFLNASVAAVNAPCFGTATGSATYSPALPGNTYAWSTNPVQTGPIATGLTAGGYSLTVTDALGCTSTFPVTIGQPQALTVAGVQVVNETCAGQNNGSASATALGGTAPYSYLWSNGSTSSTMVGGAGNYTVTITDANGCAPVTASATILANAQNPTANAGPDLIGCANGLPIALNGTITNAASGGWSGGAGTITGTGTNVLYMPTAGEIAAGSVDLTLSAVSAAGCPTATDLLHIDLSNAFVNASVATVNALCNGTATGSATYTPALPGNTYAWSTNPVQTGPIANGLAAGAYSLTVTDALGCTGTFPVTIAQPQALTIASLTSTDETCAGQLNGTAAITMLGGTSPYSYTWSNGATTPAITAGAGSYSITVTDANNCAPVVATAVINAAGQPNQANAGVDMTLCYGDWPVALQGAVVNATSGMWSGGGTFLGGGLNVQYIPSASEISAGYAILTLTTVGNTSCPPVSDQVTLTLTNSFQGATITTSPACSNASTGTAAYSPANAGLTYLWSPGGATTPVINNLASGAYTLQITDAYGCDTSMVAQVTAPPALVATTINSIAPSCFGGSNGSATVNASGGTPGYSYQWSANAGGQTTPTAVNLGSGTFNCVITDAAGCVAQGSITLTAPPAVTLTAQVPDTVCINAPTVLTAQAGGGQGGHQIVWSGIGVGPSVTYSFPASQMVQVTVTDVAGCQGPTLNLPVTVLDLSTATLAPYGGGVQCPGGVAGLGATVNNYPGPVNFSWPGLGVTGPGPHAVAVTGDATYTVIASTSCGQSLTATVTIDLEVPPTITLPPVIAEGCVPLEVTMPDSLTTDPVTYLWDLGDGSTGGGPGAVHTYTQPGTYIVSLTVTTPNGCTASATNTGVVIGHGAPTADFSASPWSTTFDAPTIQFTADQGTGITAYDWTFGDGATGAGLTPSHTYDDIGTFQVVLTVTDVNGCTGEAAHDVEILPVYDITIPNAFTPNPNGGNGGSYDPTDLGNDVFYPFVKFVKEYRMLIYNRWGELVFESNDINIGWDGYYRGQLSQQDVYVYKLWIRFVDDKEVEKRGDLTLFR